MITDKARHGLCEALVTTSVQPQIICEQTYMRWVGEISSWSKTSSMCCVKASFRNVFFLILVQNV